MAKSTETRKRILQAATKEFSAFGFAGARVDRIAANAKANKAQLYTYFGAKENLFDAVWATHMQVFLSDVPLRANDLPGYAKRLYDAWLERPELIRLGTWARLERRPTKHLVPKRMHAHTYRLPTIAAAQKKGTIRKDLQPFDMLAMIVSLSMTWSPASMTFAATARERKTVHGERRRMLADAVRRFVAPRKRARGAKPRVSKRGAKRAVVKLRAGKSIRAPSLRKCRKAPVAMSL